MNIEALRASASPFPHYGERLHHLRVAAFRDGFIIEDIGGHYLCMAADLAELGELLAIEAAGPYGGYVEELITGVHPHEAFLDGPELPTYSITLESLHEYLDL